MKVVKADLDISGNGIQKVRKTSATTINIVPISAWSDIIPDAALSAIDERLIKLDAQMRGLNDYMNALDSTQVDDLVYNDVDETLQLSANGVGIGNKVSVKEMLDEGAPVVDLNSKSEDKPNDGDDSTESNVVEF